MSKLGLEIIPFRMCQCNAIKGGACEAAVVPAESSPEVVDKLLAFVQASDYYKLSKGLMMDGPGQFRRLTRAELEARLKSGMVRTLGSPASGIEALAIVGPSIMGPNAMVSFIAATGSKKVMQLMDTLRCLIPTDHPRGPSAAETFGYLPVGCAAYALADEKTPLNSQGGESWYCPRETRQLVMEWKAGSL